MHVGNTGEAGATRRPGLGSFLYCYIQPLYVQYVLYNRRSLVATHTIGEEVQGVPVTSKLICMQGKKGNPQ